jgi:hypothetical protein
VAFDFKQFERFLRALKVQTKERGMITLGQSLLGTQRWLFEEIRRGLEDDVHEFVVLKARQLGISSAMLALDLFQVFSQEGTPGLIVTHDDQAKEQFRAMLDLYYEGLPSGWSIEVVLHNRYQLVLENGSMLQYKVAGTRPTSAKTLGRAAAISFGHNTEVAFWGDPEQIESLKASMAEKNPNRLFVWESTANGFNHFHDMWEHAQRAYTIRPIFIGWWMNEQYACKKYDVIWQKYWGNKGRPTRDEEQLISRLASEYKFALQPEQIAWYRWLQTEKITDDLKLKQEYPSVPEEAFVASGSKYFTGAKISGAYSRVTREEKPSGYQLQFGREFTDTYLRNVHERRANFSVWAEPEKDAYYVIGADPAFGASQDSDRYCAEVLRGYANRVEQVAELCCTGDEIQPYSFAWALVYLAGAYMPALLNLEVNGPGLAVLNEIDNLKKLAGKSLIEGQSKTMRDVVGKMSEYLYARDDSLRRIPAAKHTVTTHRVKETYMGLCRDNFERGVLILHSRAALDEMRTIVRNEDGGLSHTPGSHDDRVIATALGVKAWNDQLRSKLVGMNVQWIEPELRESEPKPPDTVVSRLVRNYLQATGVIKRQQVPVDGVRAYFPRPQ